MRDGSIQVRGNLMPESARKCPIPENDSASAELAEKRRVAIEMLACGQLIKRIADTLSIDPKTLYRWRQEPEFQAAVSARIREVWGEALERMRSMAVPAVDLLQKLLNSADADQCYRTARVVLKLSGFEKAMSRGE